MVNKLRHENLPLNENAEKILILGEINWKFSFLMRSSDQAE